MLCEQCQQREATIHFTQIMGDSLTKIDLCLECAGDVSNMPNTVPLGKFIEALAGQDMKKLQELCSPAAYSDMLVQALGANPRYPIEAYEFVCRALIFCGNLHFGHASAAELLGAIRKLALKDFGKRAKSVFRGWRISRTEDFGEIVFDLVEHKLIGKRPEDSKEDFQNGYDFNQVFPES